MTGSDPEVNTSASIARETSFLAASRAEGNLCALERLLSFAKVMFFFVFFLGEARTNYGSRFLAQVHCMNCRTDSKTHEPFQDLSLDIPDRLQRSRTKEQEEVCSLTYSLTRFFKVEELADSELYFCDNCMGKQRSTKRFWIHRLPNVSIVLLEKERFYYQ